MLTQLLKADKMSADRLRKVFCRLGGEPVWDVGICRELDEFVRGLAPNRRQARMLGSELNAALRDPRWIAATVSTQ